MSYGRDSRDDSATLAGQQTYQQYAEGLKRQGLVFDPRVGKVVTQAEFDQNHRGDNGNMFAKIMAVAAPFIAGGVGAMAGGASGVPSIGATSGLGSTMPGATVAGGAALPGAAAAAGTAAAHAGGGLLSGFGIKDAVGLLPGVLSMFGGHGNAKPPQDEAMNNLINMQTQRLHDSDPLYQAILRMAMGLMPISARGGMPGASQPAQAPPQMAQPRQRLR